VKIEIFPYTEVFKRANLTSDAVLAPKKLIGLFLRARV
jgi:hypothetical protein